MSRKHIVFVLVVVFFSSFAFGIWSSVRTNTRQCVCGRFEKKNDDECFTSQWNDGKNVEKKLFFSDWFKINNAPCDLDVHLKEGFCFHFSRSMQLYHVHNTAKWNHMTKLSGTLMHRVKNSEYWWAFQLFYHFSQTHHILWSPIFHWNHWFRIREEKNKF